MFSKEKASVKKPQSQKAKKIFVSEFKGKTKAGAKEGDNSFSKHDVKSTTLGLCDVIYENVKAEENLSGGLSEQTKATTTATKNPDGESPKVSKNKEKFPNGHDKDQPQLSSQIPETKIAGREISKATKKTKPKNNRRFLGLNLTRRNEPKQTSPKPVEPEMSFSETIFSSLQKEGSEGALSTSTQDSGIVSDSSTQRKRPSPPSDTKFTGKKKKGTTSSAGDAIKLNNGSTASSGGDLAVVGKSPRHGVAATSKTKGSISSKLKQKATKLSPRPGRRESSAYLLSDSSESSSLTYDTLPSQRSTSTSSASSVVIPNHQSVTSSSSRSSRVPTSEGRKSLV